MLKINQMDEQTRKMEKIESGLITDINTRDNSVIVDVPQCDGTVKRMALFYNGWKEVTPGQTVIDYQAYTSGYSQSFRTLGLAPEEIAAEVRQMVQAAKQ